VSTLRPGAPPALGALVDRLLAKEADQRVTSGAQVVAALRAPLTDSAPAMPAASPPSRSVVVLPFANLSADPENEFFSDGLTDEVITDLSRVHALRVISRTTAMHYKGTTRTLREVGEALGVSWALTGSVRKAGTALRISAQLVDVRTDEPRWAEKFSGTMDDVFDVQERVSRAIVGALDVALSPGESARLAERPLQDPRAFELYLKAREALAGYDVPRAAPLIARAVEIEGRVPVLRALQALSGIMELRSGASRDPALMARLEQEALALMAECPDRAHGHAILGFLSYERGDQATAVRALRRAMELDPADGDIRFFHGIALQSAGHGDPRAGLEWLALDPLSPLANALVACNTWFIGRPQEGLAAQEEAVRLAPAGLIYHWALGYHYLLVDRHEDAARQAAWLAEHAARIPYTAQLRALVAACAGRHAEALEILATVDQAALDGHHTFHLAESYAVAGADAEAVALLDRAVTMGFHPADYYARFCPFLEGLRGREDFERVAARAAERAAAFDPAGGPAIGARG
jgi:TolB-like protein